MPTLHQYLGSASYTVTIRHDTRRHII